MLSPAKNAVILSKRQSQFLWCNPSRHPCGLPMPTESAALTSTFLDSNSAPGIVGAQFRKSRPGAEQDLIDAFLHRMPLVVPRGCRVTVFREPRIESGFPDLVLVVWRGGVAENWPHSRASLLPRDLRLMQFIHQAYHVTEQDLKSRMGKRALESLSRLHDANMVRLAGSQWVPMSMSKIYAAERIIAIEAKIRRWSDVLNQASLNTWFASTSLALVPRLPNEWQLCEAGLRGVGVCSLEESEEQLNTPECSSLPRSYASWLFNEWAWRASLPSRNLSE